MKIVRIFAFLLAVLVIVPSALAQTGGQETSSTASEAQPITANVPVTITLLTGGSPVDLTYDAPDAETISVSARSLEPVDALDPILTVYDANGTQLATNDDHGTARTDLALRDSLVDQLALPSAGTYTIEVAAYDANSEGKIEVTLTTGTNQSQTNQTPPTNPEQTINGTVPDGDVYTTTIDGQQGAAVTITVRATDNQLDPKVTLLDSSGNEVASNDDHETPDSTLGSLDSQIVSFPFPKDDTYTIQISGFAGLGGTFELDIQIVGGASVNLPQTPTETTPQAEGTQVLNGSIDPGGTYTTNFDANVGDVYTITVRATSADFDPRVSVYLNDTYITDNDDYGTNDPTMQRTDARIYNMIITEAGSYEIDVRGYQDSAGQFELTIERVATEAPTGLPSEQVLLGTIKSGATYTTTFDAQAGDYVTITARGLTLNFDPYVALVDSNGTVLIDNDDNGSGDLSFYDARITNYHITETGTYTVEVSGYGDVNGSFGLTIGTLR